MMVGTGLAFLFVSAWAVASRPEVSALLFATANGRGALMRCAALAGLFICGAFATFFSLGDEQPGHRRGLTRALAYREITLPRPR
jgi:hypothetical protein